MRHQKSTKGKIGRINCVKKGLNGFYGGIIARRACQLLASPSCFLRIVKREADFSASPIDLETANV